MVNKVTLVGFRGRERSSLSPPGSAPGIMSFGTWIYVIASGYKNNWSRHRP